MSGRFEYYETDVSPFSYEPRQNGHAWVEDDADRERLKRVMGWKFPGEFRSSNGAISSVSRSVRNV